MEKTDQKKKAASKSSQEKNTPEKSTDKLKNLESKFIEQMTGVDYSDDPRIQEMKINFFRRHGMSFGPQKLEPRTERGRKYLEQFKKKMKAEMESESRKQPTEDDLRKAVHYVANKVAGMVNRRFHLDPLNEPILEDMMWYFVNSPNCQWDLTKGIVLFGATGVGKTMLFRIFSQFMRRYARTSAKRFKMKPCPDVYKAFEQGQDDHIAEFVRGNWCFDDLGDEEAVYKHYGNDIAVMERVITKRYNLWTTDENIYTHFTTNLGPKEIEKKYGTRIFDRLKEMCFFVEMKGKSRR